MLNLTKHLNNLLGENTGISNSGNSSAVFVMAPQKFLGMLEGTGTEGMRKSSALRQRQSVPEQDCKHTVKRPEPKGKA